MSATRDARFYDSCQEVIEDIPDGAKLLVGGSSVITSRVGGVYTADEVITTY